MATKSTKSKMSKSAARAEGVARTKRAQAAKSKPAAKRTTPKKKGILDIAAEMLARSKKPMGAKEIVERALAQGLWKTNGKTPSATLYAAMTREIAAKGNNARFKKVDRGLFTSNGGGR